MHRNESANMGADGLFPSQAPLAVITPEFVNAIQEELMNVIEQSGVDTLGQANDTRDQLYTAIRAMALRYDYIVDSQTSFVNLFTRTGANSYDINADYNSVYFKFISGGYSMANVFSGGDTWGDILTKNCKHLEFESGAYIDFANAKGNLTVETDDCYLKNVEIKGAASVAAGIIESFKLNAYRVTFDNCKCDTRLSNVDMAGFQGSGTALHNITSKYINCTAYDLDGSDKIYGFKDCQNLTNCISYQLDSSTGADICSGFDTCTQVSNCHATVIDSAAGEAYGFLSCTQVSGCQATDIDSSAGDAYGFWGCWPVSGCTAANISSNIDAIGFSVCNTVSACRANDVDSTSGAGVAYGFGSCDQVSACFAVDIDSDSGFAIGFDNCNRLSACRANDIDSISGTANGFRTCTYGSSLHTLEAANAFNDYIDTTDAAITNKFSCHPTNWT